MTQKRRGVLLSLASEEDLIELKKIDAAAAAAAGSSSSKKGSKALALEDQRRREVAERVVGMFVHKSALVEVEEEEEEDEEDEVEEEEDEEEDDDDEEEDEDDDDDVSSKKALKIKARAIALAKKKAKASQKARATAAAMIKAAPVVDESLLEKQYHVNKVVGAVRVVGYHLVEGIAVGTTLNLPASALSSALALQVISLPINQSTTPRN